VSFRPKIHPYSYKLAEKKEQRELEILSNMVGDASVVASISSIEQPTDTEESRTDRSVMDMSTASTKRSVCHERLMVRSIISQKLKDSRAEEIRKQELESCTFKPLLTAVYKKQSKKQESSSNLHQEAVDPNTESMTISEIQGDVCLEDLDAAADNNLNSMEGRKSNMESAEENVHDRLYNCRSKRHAESASTPSYMQDLQACTFTPKIRPVPSYIKAPAPAIAGFGQTVQRYRAVLETKQKQKEMDEKAHEINEAAYLKSRELARKGPEPFKLATEERRLKPGSDNPK
jgi:hypothetical protein